MLTICLWKFGIAPTSPDPLWHPDGLSLFDASSALLPDPISAGPDQSIPIKVSRHMGNLLASLGGICNALCQVRYSSSEIIQVKYAKDCITKNQPELAAQLQQSGIVCLMPPTIICMIEPSLLQCPD